MYTPFIDQLGRVGSDRTTFLASQDQDLHTDYGCSQRATLQDYTLRDARLHPNLGRTYTTVRDAQLVIYAWALNSHEQN